MSVSISPSGRVFDHDYPLRATIETLRDEQRVLRAVEAYRFFYPTVSAEAIFNGSRELGIEDGKALMILAAGPRHLAFTASSDTPYASGVLDLAAMGPVVIDMPAGPFIGLVDDRHQRWVIDLGIPGLDAGHGGEYLILPPDFRGDIPARYHVARSSTHKALLALRAMPHGGDLGAAMHALRAVRVHALATPEQALPFVDVTDRALDATPLRWEASLEYWRQLHAALQDEPVLEAYRPMYGALASLGIMKGRPFAPDVRQRRILEVAARLAIDEMRVESFASERPDRVVWADRQWEWVGLVPDDANFETRNFLDLQARDRWFFQAIVASPAMFRRQVGSGSLYWIAARDGSGAYLDGDRTYKLTVPQPVPAALFWSVTVYDAKTRSQIATPQDRAVLGSLTDPLVSSAAGDVELTFGPSAPGGKQASWIQTSPGGGFFLYFRIYGPTATAFDGSWRPGDLMISDASGHAGRDAAAAPSSITTPEVVATSLGTLAFPLGVPTADTAARVYDHIDHLHAVEAFVNSMQAVSLYAIRAGLHGAGVDDNQVLLFSGLMDSRSRFLTANCDTVYFLSILDLSSGPVVLEVPPGVLGVVDDMWFRWVVDVGMAGPDRGAGGRYLVLPPGYFGPLPEGGYFIARARTNHACVLGRAFLVDNDPAPAAARIREGLNIHGYEPGGVGSSVAALLDGSGMFAKPEAPPATRFVEGTGLAINTIPPNDVSYYDMLDAVVQLEPATALDPELAGQFAAIGIVKDRPFRPDARMQQILSDAIAVANAAARTISFRARDAEGFRYYDDSAWSNPLFVGGFEFSQPPPLVTAGGVKPMPDPNARMLGSRTAMFYLATGITPAMCMRMVGIGSQYLVSFVDSDAQALDGANTYQVTLPSGIPAGRFWSLTLYDNQTRSMVQTPQRFPRAGSQGYPSPAAIAARDGSTTVCFGPDRPDDVPEGNWIQTAPGAGYFAILRLYSPLAAFFDKSWRPSEIDRVSPSASGAHPRPM